MMYQIGNSKVEAKVSEKNESFTTYTVRVDDEEVATIEKHVFADHKNFAGKRYGYTLKPSNHFKISTVNGKYVRTYGYDSTLKAACEHLLRNWL